MQQGGQGRLVRVGPVLLCQLDRQLFHIQGVGIPLIAQLVSRAAGRIIVMPGCGVRENNIAQIEAETGAVEFHTSARSVISSKMQYRNINVPMGSSAVISEFETVQTDRRKVALYL